MAIAEVNGTTFYYELHGSGHPLVLIAGYACDHTFWTPVLDMLSRHYQVLIFDNQGVGRTSDTGGPLSVDLMAANTMQLCAQLDLHKPHIVGQSMGGCIAQTLAATYPDKVSKLALVTTSSKLREAMLFAFASLLQMRKDNIEFDLIFNTLLPWLFSEKFLRDPKRIDVFKQQLLRNPYPQLVGDQERQWHVLQQFDGRNQISRITAPTLVVYGAQDIVSLPAESKWMASQITAARVVELDCAHGIVTESALELMKLLVDFLYAPQ